MKKIKSLFNFLFKKRQQRWKLVVGKLRKKIFNLNHEIECYKVSLSRMRSNDYVYFTQIKLLEITSKLGARIKYETAYNRSYSRCSCSYQGYGYEWRERGGRGPYIRYFCEKCVYNKFSKILRKDVLEVLLSLNMDASLLGYYKNVRQQNSDFLANYKIGYAGTPFSEEIIPEFVKHVPE